MSETSSTTPIQLLDPRTTKTLTTILIFAAVLTILYIARAVVILFAFSILLAYLINPVVRFLQRHSLFFKNLRGPHVAEAYLAFLIAAVFLIHAFAPDLHRHPTRAIQNVQILVEKVSSGEIADDLGASRLERRTGRSGKSFHPTAQNSDRWLRNNCRAVPIRRTQRRHRYSDPRAFLPQRW